MKGGDMQVPPDRIVAGTYLCASAATRGKVEIENPPEGELTAFLEVYRKMGGQYEWNSGKLVADSRRVRFPGPSDRDRCISGISYRSAVASDGSVCDDSGRELHTGICF